MQPKYIIRLDDACPTFDRSRWLKVAKILDHFKIVPIIAVVPNNLDPILERDEPWPEFWEWVKRKQDINGWIIAVHGNSHIAENNKSGVLGINKKSEFSGITQNKKEKKILSSISIFNSFGLKSDIFVAPYHSFDFETLKILRKYNFKFVSDGPGCSPFYLFGLSFIPQQLWKYKKYKKGIWTICLHPNTMTDLEINDLEKTLFVNAQFFLKSKKELQQLNFNTKYSSLISCYLVMRLKRFLMRFIILIRDHLRPQ